MHAERLARVRDVIREAAEGAGRRAEDVRVLAVSKGAPVDAIRALHDAGQREFAENRADEMARKRLELPDDITWHFIGNLQRNKLRILRDVQPIVHSFDRPDLAAAWPARVPVLLQVNLAREAQKNGVPPEEVQAALEALEKAGVSCFGLTLMPPHTPDPEARRPLFSRLRAMRDGLQARWPSLQELSMGMSEDYAIAVQEGATMVRVGRALFAPLPSETSDGE